MGELTENQLDRIRQDVTEDLVGYDLEEWQKACKSFAPLHAEKETRRVWFKANRFRLDVAREIVEFVETLVTIYRGDKFFEGVRVSDLRRAIVDVIRHVKEGKGIELGKLNVVKLSGFKTLVKWADNPSELDKKSTRRPRKTEKSRKKILGTYGSPSVNLASSYKLTSETSMIIEIELENRFLHPYQSVELEINIDSNLSIREVRPYPWLPLSKRIEIGFVEASLSTDPSTLQIELHVFILEKHDEYLIEGVVHYDDCENGSRTESKLKSVTLNPWR